ncbi:Achaete scute transcription factor [Fasciolopsis buskii]|uniref:Achaete scute transcription factor n=1 Tax=Fasciolopsis buskii TaxID=27845 RepID=A0A8E0RJ69_9TREM|nr:Achaete scute transcription factor [Fasciolopsis buski]
MNRGQSVDYSKLDDGYQCLPLGLRLLGSQVGDEADKENRPPVRNQHQSKSPVGFTGTRRRPAPSIQSTSDPDLLKLDPLCSPTNNRTDSKPKTNSQKTNTIRVSRRNERERNRVRLINLGFERLRAVVPRQSGEQLSKISTLRKAIWYIEHLDRVLHEQSSSSSESNRLLPTSTTMSDLNAETNCKTVNAESTTGSTRMRLEMTSPELSNRRPLSDQRSQRQQRINPAVETGEIVIPTPRQAHQHVDDSRDRMMIDEGSRSETQGAVRMASWSYPDTPTGPCRILGSRGRSVYQVMTSPKQQATTTSILSATWKGTPPAISAKEVLAPIFPTQWAFSGMEIASTPAGFLPQTGCESMRASDSGYKSFDLSTNSSNTQEPSEQKPGQVDVSGTRLPSHVCYKTQHHWNIPQLCATSNFGTPISRNAWPEYFDT